MASKRPLCPFCEHKFANLRGVREHLKEYTRRWRIPAEGIHDVSEIKNLVIMKNYFHSQEEEEAAAAGGGGNKKIAYKCPSCAKVIFQRRKFIEHVVYRQHYIDIDGVKRNPKSSGFSFDPEPYKISPSTVKFSFHALPPEIRDLIYKALFCFERIEFRGVYDSKVEPEKGLWLQHNPPNNLLAIMATSRQVYHEARRVFYRYNTFVFQSRQALLTFLIGIGRANALLLKTVEWRLNDSERYENHIDIIKPYITQKQTSEGQPEETNIWNSEAQYRKIYQTIKGSASLCHWYWSSHRPIRLDADEVLVKPRRCRFIFNVYCYEDESRSRHVTAGYEMHTRFVMDTDRARMDALMSGSATPDIS